MKYINLKTDLGKKETFEKWNGKFPDNTSYNQVIRVTEDTAIMKPVVSLDGSDVPLAYIITNAYPNDTGRGTLTSIEDTSTMRANCSGPIDKEDMKKKGLIEGEHYKLRTPNSYHVKTKTGGWGMIAYANEIHSVMIGYKRGRFTAQGGRRIMQRSLKYSRTYPSTMSLHLQRPITTYTTNKRHSQRVLSNQNTEWVYSAPIVQTDIIVVSLPR